MKEFGGVVLLAIYGLVFHVALVWAMTIAFMFALATMNIAIGAPTVGNEFIGYWILTFVTIGASATPIYIWDLICPQLARRIDVMSIRRCAAVAGAMGAFYVVNMVEPFAEAARFDRCLFAYASPAIAVLIGLLYADVSRSMLVCFRLLAAIFPTRVKLERDDSDAVSQP